MRNHGHRLLLTSVTRPFGGPGEGDSVGAELFHAQVTRAQGAFSFRQVIRVWGLDLIAENVDAPTTVLHYPSVEELERELQRERYSHVGINFVVATFHKVRDMVALVRRVSPGTRVILGGYGTVLPDELLLPHADHVCREEGVGFIRRLLGEDERRPIVPAHSPVTSSRVLGFQQRSVVGHVTAGLGCANGCDFCCTSHFFRRRYVKLRGSGSEIYDAMMETKARAERDGQDMASFAIIDEDFFLQKKRAREFLEAVRRGGKPLSIFGFGSIKGLSQFTADEIAEMGFDLIWTAFEGKKAGYAKLDGRPIPELYEDLRRRGVGVLSSMIIGFPYQDEAAVRAEFEELMAVEPAFVQILIYFAFPGTPFFEQVLRDGRFLPQYQRSADLRRWDGFALHHQHPHFTPEKLEALQRELYRQDFRRLGPSLHRLMRGWLRGIEHLEGSPNALLRARAERLRRASREVYPTLRGTRWLLPSAAARARLDALYGETRRVIGPPTLHDRLLEPGSGLLAGMEWATQKLGVLQQPSLLRAEYHTTEDGERVHASDGPGRLQSQGASLIGRLREDFRHLVLERLRPPTVDASGPAEGWKPVGSARRSLHVAPSTVVEDTVVADAAE